jgi:hypothetical protein
VQNNLALVIEDAQEHLLGVEIDAAGEFVALLIESHFGSPGLSRKVVILG